jgi:ribosomal protein S18 acetylase RimI-like enzyme
MIIRPLAAEDYDALVALWQAAGLPYKPRGRDRRERIAAEIQGPCSVFLAAESEGRLVGAVLGTHDGRKGWINRLAVLPERRGAGIARALIDALEARLAERGIDIVACLVEDWNEGSQRCFERLGYRPFEGITYLTKRRVPEV